MFSPTSAPTRQGFIAQISYDMEEQIKGLTLFVRAATFGWFHLTSIQVNLTNYAPHADSQNVGPSYIIGAGHYEGGAFLIWRGGERYDIDIAGSGWVTDGLLAHGHSRFIGQRGSLVAFCTPLALPSYGYGETPA